MAASFKESQLLYFVLFFSLGISGYFLILILIFIFIFSLYQAWALQNQVTSCRDLRHFLCQKSGVYRSFSVEIFFPKMSTSNMLATLPHCRLIFNLFSSILQCFGFI